MNLETSLTKISETLKKFIKFRIRLEFGIEFIQKQMSYLLNEVIRNGGMVVLAGLWHIPSAETLYEKFGNVDRMPRRKLDVNEVLSRKIFFRQRYAEVF